jgi:hypothetical protein
LDHADAEAGEARDGIVRRNGGDHAFDVDINGRPIDVGCDGRDPELVTGPHLMRAFTGRDQCLGGHAAVVEAIAAHLVALEQDHLDAHLGRGGGKGQATRARADDAEIAGEVFARRAGGDVARGGGGLTRVAGRDRLQDGAARVRTCGHAGGSISCRRRE